MEEPLSSEERQVERFRQRVANLACRIYPMPGEVAPARLPAIHASHMLPYLSSPDAARTR